MMKKIVIMILLLSLIPTVIAYDNLIDNVLTFDKRADTVCDSGEFPILDNECNTQYNFFNSGWFWKTIIGGIILLAIYSQDILKTKVFWILLAVFILSVYFISNDYAKPTEKFINTTTTYNVSNGTTFVLPQSEFEKGLDNVASLPEKLGGKGNKGFGLFLLMVIIIVLVPAFRVLIKNLERFFSR